MEHIENRLENTPKWIRPDLYKERGELQRVVRDFLQMEPNPENINRIMDILNASPMIELSDNDWEALENTDSFHAITPGQVETARDITEEYNIELQEENKRNFDDLLTGFLQGNNMECPTILKNKDGKLHLISGNTRLMIARALDIRPNVIIGEVM